MSPASPPRRARRQGLATALLALLVASSCAVGPDYARPALPVASGWLEANQPRVAVGKEAELAKWWERFEDPTLAKLVETAYGENLSLRAAGLRVLQAQARRAVAIGRFFPQQQELSASYTHSRESANTSLGSLGGRDRDSWQAGFDAVWELDLWGKFRRGIESADADLIGAVAGYDDVLVSLVAEVAATYVRLRVLEERLAVAINNVRVQHDSLDIARVRAEAGGTSDLDVQQATALLKDTEATIPQLSIQLRQAIDSLCVLLGSPPSELRELLGEKAQVPKVPPSIAVGIPADLLRRRPDVRRAEQAAAAQSARIGVSVAQLLPSFQIVGSAGVSAEDAENFLQGRSFEGNIGPAIHWPILNYGRLINDVRLQDATFQELLATYGQTVLVAQQEVEDALIGYLRGSEQVERLVESVAAAGRAVEIAGIQYREGATDFTSVLNTQQLKIREEDLLATTRGSVALSVIALYKALGGGWEIREGRDFVPIETRETMEDRGYWRWWWGLW